MVPAEKTLGPFLVNNFGDRYLYAVNRNAFNGIGSDALYQSLFGEDLFDEYQFNVVVGTDSGMLPKFVAKHGVPEGSRYLFVELPEVAEFLTQEGVLEGLPSEICVTTLDRWMQKARELQLSEYIFLDGVYSRHSVGSSDAHLPEYRDLSWSLSLELKTVIHKTHTSTNCTMFVLRQMENLTENRVLFAETLVGACAGKTAIILAGGPSLKDAIPWVKANRERVVIVAVSRISRLLQDEGIVPHLIATVDPQVISFEVSREMLRFQGDVMPVAVSSHHASPPLVGQWHGQSAYTASLFPWRTPLNRDKLVYTGPTVGNYALSLAMHLGCRQIVLAGVDLCFTPQGQTHASGSNENKVGPDLGQFSPRLETYGGWHADTNQGYAEALSVLGVQARIAAQQGHRLYNCSLSAAKVPLIDFISLDDLDLGEDDDTPAALIARRLPEATSEARLAHYQMVKSELSRVRRKFQEILNLSRKALECADGLFGRNGRKQDFRHKIRMDKIERHLDEGFEDLTALVKQFGIRKFLTILRAPKDPEQWSDEQVEKATRDYYEAYLEGTQSLIELVDQALERVAVRIEEEKDTPELDRLAAQWRKDCQPGRARLLRRRRPDLKLDAEQLAELARLEEEFEQVMTEERTSQIELLEKLHDVRHTRSKAFLLFKRKELEELRTMAKGLAEHPQPEKAQPYLLLVNGLVAELEEKPEEALIHYQQLLDGEEHDLTEDALMQIASLAIRCGDLENALLTLDCLAGLSPAYLPPYGDLLKAVGRYEEAFNAYNRYVGIVPDDVGGVMKLAVFCAEAGLREPARGLFLRVLERDPHNDAAQKLLKQLDAA